jgi:hypothetical protein
MTERVVWSLPAESPMSGQAHGVAAILKRANTLQGFNVLATKEGRGIKSENCVITVTQNLFSLSKLTSLTHHFC